MQEIETLIPYPFPQILSGARNTHKTRKSERGETRWKNSQPSPASLSLGKRSSTQKW